MLFARQIYCYFNFKVSLYVRVKVNTSEYDYHYNSFHSAVAILIFKELRALQNAFSIGYVHKENKTFLY